MKTILAFALLVIILIGCSGESPADTYHPSRTIKLVTVRHEGCEYIIGNWPGHSEIALIHKENCDNHKK